MALTDTRLRNLKGKEKPYQLADGRGLFIEVTPGGKRVWRMRYRLGGRQEKVTLGEYPAYSLTEAREWRERCSAMVERNQSPMDAKRAEKQAQRSPDMVEPFAYQWLKEVVEKTNKNPRGVRRVIEKEIVPAIGKKTAGKCHCVGRTGDYGPD